ncbi:MAG TPA: response regulator, partial [Planctomycetota bacterium]|nr:response regulator [Planctomycetota bacterium]
GNLIERQRADEDRVTAEALREEENRILEMIARNAPLPQVLDRLLRSVEAQAPGMFCSILRLLDDGLHVQHMAAPSLSEDYLKAIDGASIGPCAGSCGTAMYRKQLVIVTDTSVDPLWADSGHHKLAETFGLRACWSSPILAREGRVLGSFAMYYHEPRSPSPAELWLIEHATHVAGIAIEHDWIEHERRKMEEQLRHSQKMEALGQLAGGMAHDFNNLLTAILGYAELVLAAETDHKVRGEVEEIRRAGERAAALTRQLLALARKQVLAPEALDLNGVVADMAKLLRRLVREDIDLELKPDPDLPGVLADRGQMEQVVLNLALNASDAMPGGGQLTIETRREVLGENAARLGAEPGTYALLAIHDTGTGMDAETKAQIFVPYFTTKPKGKGTGLGLATVYGIVKQSDGYILAISEKGHGTTLEVRLPAMGQVPYTASTARAAAPRVGGEPQTRGTVLVVEDEDAVRRLTATILEAAGYTVLASSGHESALEAIALHEGPLGLILSDLVMPGMSGPELAARVRALRPAVRIIYMSGYSDEAVARHGALTEAAAFLQKPFTAAQLLETVRSVLQGEP